MQILKRNQAEKKLAELLLEHDGTRIFYESFHMLDWFDEINDLMAQNKLTDLPEHILNILKNPEWYDLVEALDIEYHKGFYPVYVLDIIFSFRFVTNEYLINQLCKFNIKCKIKGQEQKAGLCPCCLHYSIEYGEDGLWDICLVCFWENGGDGLNHMTLEEAQDNFKTIGAINQRHIKHVDKDGVEKYKKLTY